MSLDLYFRIRDHGATVYRLDAANRNNRLEMHLLANVNVRTGEVKAARDMEVTEAEAARIDAWIRARRARLAAAEADLPARAVEALNEAAQWLQTRASDAEVEAAADALLLAMHDLRSVIVRRKSDMLGPRD